MDVIPAVRYNLLRQLTNSVLHCEDAIRGNLAAVFVGLRNYRQVAVQPILRKFSTPETIIKCLS